MAVESSWWRRALWGVIHLALLIACSPPDIVITSNSGSNSDEGQSEEGQSDDDYTFDTDINTNSEVSSIAYLKGLYNGNSYYIAYDIAIEGIITANDAYGEYPNSLIIEDESGAIELKSEVGCTTLGFTVGRKVRLYCSGLRLGSTGGMLSVGAEPYDQYETGYLSLSELSMHLRLCDDEVVIPTPVVATISNLSADYILRFVWINNLRVVTSEDSTTTFCSRSDETGRTEYTEHTLVDMQGNEITLTVDRNVVYADEALPVEWFSASGIVEYFNGEYRLRIVNCGYI